MAEDAFFPGLFDEQPPVHAMIPVAPQLLVNGQPFVIPPHLAQSIVRGVDPPRPPSQPVHHAAADEDDLPALPNCRFAVPLLRRDPSLRKNTPAALEGRLAELAAASLAAEHAHRLRMLELETAQRTEELVYAQAKLRRESEKLAVEQALKHVELERQQRRNGIGVSKVSASASSCPLLVDRSPGESTVTGEECGCGVCLERDRDTLVAPCGHVALCFPCAEAIKDSRNPECPFCRTRITACYKLFVV